MKRNTPSSPQSSFENLENHSEPLDDWAKGDPLWDILDQASTAEPNAFFARNTVRTSRQLQTPSLYSRVISLFNARRLALGAAACACVIMGYQAWPTSETLTTQVAPVVAQTNQSTDSNTNLSELVIEETLLAAAEDPSIFTRDEVVTMLGL